MHNPSDYLIFWLPSGYNFDNSTIDSGADNPSNAHYEQLITRYFTDICKPNSFYAIIQQYPDRSSNISSCSVGGSWVDTSNYIGGRGSQSNPLSDSDIQSEVIRAMNVNGWIANTGNSEFFVYTGYNVFSCAFAIGCSFTDYCAYHSSYFGVIYANMPDVGSPDPRYGFSFCLAGFSPNNDNFADSEINTSSHEQFEAFTDPTHGGWFYQDGSHEIGDECNFVFDGGAATLVIGADGYRVQEEWSNNFGGCTSQGFGCASTAVATDFLGCDGQGPTTIGLTWGQSGYGTSFNNYQVQQSNGPNGPWATIGVISSISSTTEYVRDLLPNSTYWWRVVEVCCSGLATTTTNALQVTQPNGSRLTYTTPTQSSIRLTWNNNALYTGSVAFGNYVLWESMNQGTYVAVANVTSEPTTSFTVNTSTSNGYSFYLTTTDECNGCSGQGLSLSNSNLVSIGGPAAFVGGLFGEYWNATFFGSSLTGCTTYNSPTTPSLPPAKTNTDPQVNFGLSTAWNWHPFGNGNEFSVKWIGGIMIPMNGTYSFQLVSDDGSWLYLDSALIINHGGQRTLSDSRGTASVSLTKGVHQIEVDYYETCGPPSGITLSWSPPGTTGSVLVPPNVLVAPPRLDGQGLYSGSCLRTDSCQSISTTYAQDVILLVANCQSNTISSQQCTGITPSVSDSSGLAFITRATYCYSGSSFVSCLWEYYALANSLLNNDNITSLPNHSGVRWQITTLAVSGVNTNSIFDPLLAVGQHCPASDGSPANCTISFTTSSASAPAPYEFLLTNSALNDAGQCYPPPSQGWSLPIFYNGKGESEYQIAPLTRNYSFTCTSNGDPLIILADGIRGLIPDFAVTADPSRVTVDAGVVGNSAIALTSLNGFSGQIGLTSSPSPAGLSCSLSPARILLNFTASSTLSCSGIAGSYNVTVTASGGGESHLQTLTFIVMDFDIAASPISLTMAAGSNSTSTISLKSRAGYSSNVTLACTGGLPAGASCSFKPVFGTPDFSSILTISTQLSTPTGTYNVTFTGTDGSLTHSRYLTFTLSYPKGTILSWQGYDWDGGGEETLTLNGQFLASLPVADTPLNGGTWATFSLNITSFVVPGVNTLTFTHANFDCAISDNVRSLQVSNAGGVVYSNSTVLPLSCTQSLTYSFTIASSSVGGSEIPINKLVLVVQVIPGLALLISTIFTTLLIKRLKDRKYIRKVKLLCR